MKSNLTQFNAQVESVNSRKDKSIKLVITTDDMECGSGLIDLSGRICSVGVSPYASLTKADVEMLQDKKLGVEDLPDAKSKGQRLRNVFFVLSQQEDKEDFEAYYSEMMEKIIEFYKSKIK